MAIQIEPLSGSLGAVISGVDPCHLDDAAFAGVHAALVEHEVVFFRRTALDDETQMALAWRFGKPSVFPMFAIAGHTEPTFQVIEDGPDSRPTADSWHTDVTWTAEPPKVALLRAGIVPERGGDTMWASTTSAYESLSPTMQELLAGLEVWHDNTSFIRQVAAKMGTDESAPFAKQLRESYPPVKHPLVRTHPETGRRSILYGGGFMREIVGMKPDESRTLLDFLERHLCKPELACRWSWEPGDLAIWDERSTVHRAVADHFPQRRSVHRCVVDGDRPFFDAARVPEPAHVAA